MYYVPQQRVQLCHISLFARHSVHLGANTTGSKNSTTSTKVTDIEKFHGAMGAQPSLSESGTRSGTCHGGSHEVSQRPSPATPLAPVKVQSAKSVKLASPIPQPPAAPAYPATPTETGASTPVRSFVAEGKHAQSSDDEDSDAEYPLRLLRSRKRRRTVCVAAPTLSRAFSKPISSNLMDSGSEQEFLSSVLLRRQQHMRRRSIASDADRAARRRCFEYLLSGIDAVWAEYCDSTLLAEEQRYTPRSPVSDCEVEPVSEQPHSVQLMMLKKQMLGSKYYMSDLVDTHDMDASSRFWKCWDNVKYNVVEAVEGELDEPEGDKVLEDLEAGRLWSL